MAVQGAASRTRRDGDGGHRARSGRSTCAAPGGRFGWSFTSTGSDPDFVAGSGFQSRPGIAVLDFTPRITRFGGEGVALGELVTEPHLERHLALRPARRTAAADEVEAALQQHDRLPRRLEPGRLVPARELPPAAGPLRRLRRSTWAPTPSRSWGGRASTTTTSCSASGRRSFRPSPRTASSCGAGTRTSPSGPPGGSCGPT